MYGKRIAATYIPLSVSFTLMMLEGPSVQAAITRLGESALNLAAFGLVMSLSLIIESPVIMLLSTAIALVHDRQSYLALRRFTVTLIVALTLLTALVAWTPLYDLIAGGVLGIPDDISATARPALGIMLLWTGAIGWRRFYQGLLVRQGQSARVSYGTAIRLSSTIITAVALVVWGGVSGAQVGAYALMAGVLSEAAVTYLFARPAIRRIRAIEADGAPLTTAAIMRFHIPLAATSLLTLVVQPLTAAALARMALPERTLAAWPVVFSTLLVLRGWGMAIQETAVAQAADQQALPALRRFTWLIAAVTTIAAVLLAWTPLLNLHLRYIISLEPDLWAMVRIGLQIAILLPALTALTSLLRGLLVAASDTASVYQGMGVNLLLNSAALMLGVVFGASGVAVAAIGLLLAIGGEYLFLRRRFAAATRRHPLGSVASSAA